MKRADPKFYGELYGRPRQLQAMRQFTRHQDVGNRVTVDSCRLSRSRGQLQLQLTHGRFLYERHQRLGTNWLVEFGGRSGTGS